ncbi:MAG: hypothetical protein FWC15_09215, partial [Fibromonadales bacterium]|nr:hypothetical protein [Fibromonadales bacterium]
IVEAKTAPANGAVHFYTHTHTILSYIREKILQLKSYCQQTSKRSYLTAEAWLLAMASLAPYLKNFKQFRLDITNLWGSLSCNNLASFIGIQK